MLMKPVVYPLNKHNSVIKIELVKIVERSFQSAFAVTAYCYLMKIFFVAIYRYKEQYIKNLKLLVKTVK